MRPDVANIAESFLRSVVRLRRDERGVFIVIFAAALVPMLALIGVLIDSTRAQNARLTLQNAIDGAVLAAAKLNDVDSRRTAIANSFFRGAMANGFPGTVGVPAFAVTNGSVSVTGAVEAVVPTTFGAIIGRPGVTIGARAASLRPRLSAHHG